MVRTQHKQRGYGFVLCVCGGSTRKASRAGNSVVASGLQLNWRQGTAVVTAHGCVGASGNNQVISSISILLRESGLTLPESLVRLWRPDTAARRNGVGRLQLLIAYNAQSIGMLRAAMQVSSGPQTC